MEKEELRKLILGKYYWKCKNKISPVSNLLLNNLLQDLQDQGLLLNCNLNDLIRLCEFKKVESPCFTSIQSSQFPKNNIIDQLSLDEDEQECPICLEEFDEEKIEIERLSPCGHYAHKSCIQKSARALVKSPFCPLCKETVTNVENSILEKIKARVELQQDETYGNINDRERNFINFIQHMTRFESYVIFPIHLILEWNLKYPNLQITREEIPQFEDLARKAFLTQWIEHFDPDVGDEPLNLSEIEMFELIKNRFLKKFDEDQLIKLGPLEIETLWNQSSPHKINLRHQKKLFELLNLYRIYIERKIIVENKFRELYLDLNEYDPELSKKVLKKYNALRVKEEKDKKIPGEYVEKELFNKKIEQLNDSCQIM